MNDLSRAVARSLPDLELKMFQEWDDRYRWAEIRQLAKEQLADDQPGNAPRDRVGRTWVGHAGVDTGRPLWERVTPEQERLADAMTPLLVEVLTPKQRDAIRLLYFGQLSEQQAALAMGIARATLREHRDAALAKLRQAITDKYLAASPNVTD